MCRLILTAFVLLLPVSPGATQQNSPVLPSSSLAMLAPLPELALVVLPPQGMSELGIAFLKSVEEFRSTAYHDSGGGYSIGYGFQTWRGRRVTPAFPNRVTEEEAAVELARQLSIYEDIVRREFGGRIPQHSFDALVSICYNLGRLNTSILLKIRQGLPVDIQDFLTTAAVRDGFSPSLYSRRVREFAMFIGRYEDALNADLAEWPAARRAHQKLRRHSLRVTLDGVISHRRGFRPEPGD